MKHSPKPEESPAAGGGWTFGSADLGISAALFALSVAVCLPLALHFRAQSCAWEERTDESTVRTTALRSAIAHLDSRRAAMVQFRHELTKYVAEVEAKPIVPWTTEVAEMSRHRPRGLWTVRLSGSGPHFRARVAAERADLVTQYAQSLRQSPYMDFAALPAGAAPATHSQLVGRLVGE
jgi:hypothetical protein